MSRGDAPRLTPAHRRLAIVVASAAIAWAAIAGAIRLMESAALPQVPLMTMAGEQTTLAALAQGGPMVVNLWATWCAPCRREMPVLATAQQQEPAVRFVFANQGEDRETARRFLADAGLDLANVVIDPGARIGREVGSAALPTTLFYDGRGRLVDTHIGELSAAALAVRLRSLRAEPVVK